MNSYRIVANCMHASVFFQDTTLLIIKIGISVILRRWWLFLNPFTYSLVFQTSDILTNKNIAIERGCVQHAALKLNNW